MSEKIIRDSEVGPHPKHPGVFLRHYFCGEDNGRLNNLELRIDPGFGIPPHIHDQATEFFYIISGTGEFLIDGEWHEVGPGQACKAPTDEEHGFRVAAEGEPLLMLATFSPPVR
jgi:quercetin dioxygenase-like cupin family protein